jgi:hypothetical protein
MAYSRSHAVSILPLSMTIAVFALLLAYPSVSIGLKPSNGGSRSVHTRVGGGLGELRPEFAAGGSMRDGMVDVVRWKFIRGG